MIVFFFHQSRAVLANRARRRRQRAFGVVESWRVAKIVVKKRRHNRAICRQLRSAFEQIEVNAKRSNDRANLLSPKTKKQKKRSAAASTLVFRHCCASKTPPIFDKQARRQAAATAAIASAQAARRSFRRARAQTSRDGASERSDGAGCRRRRQCIWLP